LPINCYLSEITKLKYTSLTKIIIKGENFKWHLEAFASELFIYIYTDLFIKTHARVESLSTDPSLLRNSLNLENADIDPCFNSLSVGIMIFYSNINVEHDRNYLANYLS